MYGFSFKSTSLNVEEEKENKMEKVPYFLHCLVVWFFLFTREKDYCLAGSPQVVNESLLTTGDISQCILA